MRYPRFTLIHFKLVLIFSVTLVSIKYNIGLTKKEALHLSDKERLIDEALINTGTFLC